MPKPYAYNPHRCHAFIKMDRASREPHRTEPVLVDLGDRAEWERARRVSAAASRRVIALPEIEQDDPQPQWSTGGLVVAAVLSFLGELLSPFVTLRPRRGDLRMFLAGAVIFALCVAVACLWLGGVK